jgi:hypothetical protein
MNTHYIIQTASAQMPSSCKGIYKRIAVLEVAAGINKASMISERVKDVVRVVETWERLNVGKTEKCAYARAMVEAEALRRKLMNRHERQRFGS